MMDKEKIRLLNSKLILGDLKKTIPAFKKLSKSSPIGFFAMDVDIYSSTKYALNLFKENPDFLFTFRILLF